MSRWLKLKVQTAVDDITLLTDQIHDLQNATAVPPSKPGGGIGVLDRHGHFVPASREFIPPFQAVSPPDPKAVPENPRFVEGTYLYAGWMHQHFGHAISETIARLWPLVDRKDEIDGIVILSRGPKTIWRARQANRRMLDIFSLGIPDIPVTHPTCFERLLVPDAACGIGERMKGTPAFKRYLDHVLAGRRTETGPEKIYLSRRKLPGKKGRIFGETQLAEHLSSNGYQEIHLQDMTLDQQIEVVSNARYIVSPDGSPMHLVSYFARPGAKVAMIVRRDPREPNLMAGQFASLQGRELLYLDQIVRIWNNANTDKVNNTVLAELDLVATVEALALHGFITKTSTFQNLEPDQIYREQAGFGRPRMHSIWERPGVR